MCMMIYMQTCIYTCVHIYIELQSPSSTERVCAKCVPNRCAGMFEIENVCVCNETAAIADSQ